MWPVYEYIAELLMNGSIPPKRQKIFRRVIPAWNARLLRLDTLVLMLIAWFMLGSVSAQQAEDLIEFDQAFIQGALITGKTSAKALFVNDIEVEVAADGHFVFGFGRDAAKSVAIKQVMDDAVTHELRYEVAQRNYDIQKIEGVASKYVSPPAAVTERIRSDNRAVKRARSLVDLKRRAYLEGFQLPAKGPISGVYGSQRVFNGVPKRPHYGLDIAAPVGTPVYAPVSGIVTLAHDDMYYSGATLILDHGRGVSSTFLHLSEITVEEGQLVEKGQLIAKIGKSGRVTGPHLDWRMNWKSQRIDPQLLLADD
jgi:murein DD-endopeptidase MepM/ murein hydrolase activator NlpD